MDEWSGVAAIAGVVGSATGIIGLVVAGVANRRTKQANKLAQAEVSVLVDPKRIGEVIRAEGTVPRGGEIVVPFPEVPDQRQEHRRATEARIQSADAAGVIMIPRSYGRDVEFDIRWVSEARKPGQQTIKLHLS